MSKCTRAAVAVAVLGGIVASPVLAQDEISTLCATVYKAAASAVANRAAGHGAAQLRAALPAREAITGEEVDAQLARVLHEVIDEVYGGEPLDQSAYAVYRTELCVREQAQLPVPASFATVRDALMACGRKEGEARIDCAVAIASDEP